MRNAAYPVSEYLNGGSFTYTGLELTMSPSTACRWRKSWFVFVEMISLPDCPRMKVIIASSVAASCCALLKPPYCDSAPPGFVLDDLK